MERKNYTINNRCVIKSFYSFTTCLIKHGTRILPTKELKSLVSKNGLKSLIVCHVIQKYKITALGILIDKDQKIFETRRLHERKHWMPRGWIFLVYNNNQNKSAQWRWWKWGVQWAGRFHFLWLARAWCCGIWKLCYKDVEEKISNLSCKPVKVRGKWTLFYLHFKGLQGHEKKSIKAILFWERLQGNFLFTLYHRCCRRSTLSILLECSKASAKFGRQKRKLL